MISETARQRFTEQVLPHLDDAYTLARWLTGNPTDAEDVVQDACMRALRALDGAPVEHPRAWLLAVIRNTAFTWLAKNRPHAVVLAGGAEEAHAHQGALEEQAAPTPEGSAHRQGGACKLSAGSFAGSWQSEVRF
jgi:RNA polymerase sigma factor (sigma-70 family)